SPRVQSMPVFLQAPSPRLPARRGRAFAATTVGLHIAGAALLMLLAVPVIERQATDAPTPVPAVMHVVLPNIVFGTPRSRKGDPGRGGGGGGNRQPAPIRHAEGKGQDVLTLRIKQPLATPDVVIDPGPELPALALDARPVASGMVDQVGLPVGGVPSGIST